MDNIYEEIYNLDLKEEEYKSLVDGDQEISKELKNYQNII